MANENVAKKPSFLAKIKRFFKDIGGEIKKIVWPTKKQVLNNTVVVLVMVAIVAVAVWGLDSLLSYLRNLLINAF